MKTWNQFWALLKFQPSVNPFILFLPLVLLMPFFITRFTGSMTGNDFHSSLDSAISNQNIFWIGFIGVMWFAPEIFQFGTTAAVYSTGTEFLLTRAVDRSVLYRSRVVSFYLLVLVIPLISLFMAWPNPALQVGEYSKLSHQQILAHLPGSIAAPPDKYGRSTNIMLPTGNILVESWHLWIYLMIGVGTQILIFLIYPMKYRRPIFWTIYFGLIFLPLFFSLHELKQIGKPEKLSSSESTFFIFAAHQPFLWAMTALAVIFGHLWCERRFAHLEQ